MKRVNTFSFVFLVACFLCLRSMEARATIDTIKFGGSLGNAFSPNTLSVHVGDTIRFIGAFGFHEISSTSVPSGAAAFGPTASNITSFDYIVTIAGSYAYQCDFHFAPPDNMIGSFDAITASVNQGTNPNLSLEQNYPNPSNGVTTIKYTLLRASEVQLTVSNIEGKTVKQLINKFQGAGSYETQLDVSTLTSGTYIYQLQAGDAILSRQMIVVKN